MRNRPSVNGAIFILSDFQVSYWIHDAVPCTTKPCFFGCALSCDSLGRGPFVRNYAAWREKKIRSRELYTTDLLHKYKLQ